MVFTLSSGKGWVVGSIVDATFLVLVGRLTVGPLELVHDEF